ncbi:MAG: Gx transporter family protein [Lachnospiraceae bacterium]|nr:Gx transporter family protein [Lachnospiraceae bacterium]
MKTGGIAEYGLLGSLAMVLSYVESQMPVFFAVPGMKLGLTNLVVLLALYRRGERAAFAVNIVRIVLTAFTFGSLSAMLYSLAGGIVSFLVMVLCRRSGKFSMTGVSIAGGVSHNIGQTAVAVFVLETAQLAYYLPFLMIAGTAAGFAVGLTGSLVAKRLPAGS